MRCVGHISDLHFGTEDTTLETALLEDLRQQDPALIVVSGDLTQRARTSQFRKACSFLEQLPSPTLVVPGNHDVPLYDLFRRFLSPLGRYQKYIDHIVDPFFEDEEIAVLGLNTARSLTWKRGRISWEQMEVISEAMEKAGGKKFKILVTHHPFIPPPGELAAGIDLVGRASEALSVIDKSGVDLLLAGHLHHGYSGDVRTYYPATTRSIIVVQAGTAISRRVRSEPNAYNLLRLDRSNITVEVRLWDGSKFKKSLQAKYTLHGLEWRLGD